MTNLTELLTTAPPLHEDADGVPISWALPQDVLAFLASNVGRHSMTLETGAGLSTLVFAAAGACHTCIVPDAQQVERIRRYCSTHEIGMERVQFHVGPSEAVLPTLRLDAVDLVLIDGRHGFPAPFIDWHYSSLALKVGGLMIVDDTQLWTGQTLRDFLAEEADWVLEHEFAKTAVFRKLADGHHRKEWNQQPYVRRQSGLAMRS